VSSVGKTLRNELKHLVANILASVLFYKSSHHVIGALVVFVVAMFMDVDHLVDYGLYCIRDKQWPRLSEFLSGQYFKKWQKFVCPLHAWEIAIVALIAWSFFPACLYYPAVVLGIVTHLVVDYYTNTVNRVAYFFCFRAYHSFHKPAIAP